ncbi:MAG: IucA/IucC family C-terminal-domain containing protein [Actinomycetota bacterium]
MPYTSSLQTGGAPLAATLGRLAARSGAGGLDLSARPDTTGGDGWVTPSDLASNAGLMEELLLRLGAGEEAGYRAYAGTSLFRYCLWRVLVPAVAAFLTERRVPDLRPESVALRFGEKGYPEDLAFLSPGFAALPDDPDAGHPDVRTVCSEEKMLAFVGDRLAEGHARALIPALRGLRVRRGARALWGAAVDVVAEAFMYVGRELGCQEEALGFAEQMLSGGSPLSGPANYYLLEHGGEAEMTRVRNTCCLYYKVADGPCFTCPRITHEERLRRMRGL